MTVHADADLNNRLAVIIDQLFERKRGRELDSTGCVALILLGTALNLLSGQKLGAGGGAGSPPVPTPAVLDNRGEANDDW